LDVGFSEISPRLVTFIGLKSKAAELVFSWP
jgi:hypothetical protein